MAAAPPPTTAPPPLRPAPAAADPPPSPTPVAAHAVERAAGHDWGQVGAYAASLDDIKAAAARIAGAAHVTPVMTCSTLDRMSGHQLFFKCENLQRGGSFKVRGAANAVFQLPADVAAQRGVVTHSSGNHASALALAAQLRGIPAHIVVPSNAPACKLAAVREYGGTLILCEPTMAAREQAAARVQAETGATLVPPYDDPAIIAGQGTIGLEFLQQVPQLDVIVVPVSGGGMLSGITLAAKAVKPGIRIVAAEPLGSNNAADVAASKAAGRLISDMDKPATIADGLQARLGRHTWPVVRDMVDAVVVVEERAILEAMQLVMERMKLVVEPSGAVGLAAALAPDFKAAAVATAQGHEPPAAEKQLNVGVILCGGNLDLVSGGFFRPENWQPQGC